MSRRRTRCEDFKSLRSFVAMVSASHPVPYCVEVLFAILCVKMAASCAAFMFIETNHDMSSRHFMSSKEVCVIHHAEDEFREPSMKADVE